jgi:exodeoxyribonuclease V alpha subunit
VADVEGIGFNRADGIADELGIEADSPARIQAAVLYTLSDLSLSNGDTYVEAEPLLKRTLNLLEESRPFIIDPEQIADSMIAMVEEQTIIKDETRFYLPSLYASEWGIVTAIERINEENSDDFNVKEFKRRLKQLEKDLGISYGDSQKEAIEEALRSQLFILTGGPGTGKTTVVEGIVTLFAEMNDLSLDPYAYKGESFPILLAAPTGRAAKRMKETTGLPASTIHRLLGLTADEDEQEPEDTERNLKGELLVIDEMSMVDTWLAYQLLKAVPKGMKVIMVGDKDQLPSVGPGQVLRDLLESGKIAQKELTDIYRQGDDSSIIPLAHEMKKGRLPKDFTQPKKDRNFFACKTHKVLDVITQVVTKAIERGYTAAEVQVLAPMYKGPAGIDNLNKHLQELFNPNEDGRKKEVKHIENVYRIGDKVLQLVNDPERNVFNGDMGVITGIIPKAESDTKSDEIVIDFEGNEVQYLRNEWNKITLAYCCSIHKAQGSEYDMVILPLVSSYRRMLKKDLLYTAITRASKFLILCGEESAYRQSLESTSMLRKTTLKERLITDEVAPILTSEDAFEEEEAKEVERELETSEVENGEMDLLSEEKILTPELIELRKIDPMIGMNNLTPYSM